MEGQTATVEQDIEVADLEALVSDLSADDLLDRPSIMCEIAGF